MSSSRSRSAPYMAFACLVLLAIGAPASARAALPSVGVDVATVPLADIGQHRGVTVTATCPGGSRLVGGGGYLRRTSDPTVAPTNGLVLGGTTASTGASPVDLAARDGTVDPASWTSIANYTGVSETGNQASTFALCAAGASPSHTVVRSASRTGTVAAQELSPPDVATATCPAGTRLIGGGATTSTPDQVNDGVTVGNSGNLKPLGDYPSDAAGVPAAAGSTSADSWSAYGSAGITSTTDTVTAFALCSSDPGTPPVSVARDDVDGPDAQQGTTSTTATATCPADTRLLGGGYRVDETVAGVGSALQPQQGYHLRGSHPGDALDPAVAGASDPSAWTALVQAGGQNLAAGKHMTTHAFAMCLTQPPPPDSADLSLAIAGDPDPVLVGATLTYTLTVSNGGPSAATGVVLSQTLPDAVTFASAASGAGSCTQAAGVVGCTLGTIASGASATVTVAVVADAAVTLDTSASVRSDVNDPTPGDDDATAHTTAQLPVRATPSLHGVSPDAATLGAPIADAATLAGGDAATGTISFDLYGPGDVSCATPITSSTAPVSGDGTYGSTPHTTTAIGVYRWVVGYGGDGANGPAATACGDPGQTVSVKAAPTLLTRASAPAPAGGAITATATLAGGTIVTGTLTFRVYGPGDEGCTTPLRTSVAAVSGNGIYSAPAFATGVAGTYRWVAEYGGDASNRAAGPTACADPAAALEVSAVAPPLGAPLTPPAGSPPLRPPPAGATRASSAFTFASSRVDRARQIRLGVKSPGPGRFAATATARLGGKRRTFAAAAATARRKATIVLTLAPGASARRELRRHSLDVTVAVTFRPVGGVARTRTAHVMVPRWRPT
jgi:uncharacterized repeat protein (TIGR01451 family)